MSKTSTELLRHALNGPTMGTRWSALFFTPQGFDGTLHRDPFGFVLPAYGIEFLGRR